MKKMVRLPVLKNQLLASFGRETEVFAFPRKPNLIKLQNPEKCLIQAQGYLNICCCCCGT